MQRQIIEYKFRSHSFRHCFERLLMHIAVLAQIHHSASSSMVTPHVRLIVLGREALMEILGLVPYQSQTQYLEKNLRAIAERQQRGNLLLLCFRSPGVFPIQRQQSGNLFPPCFRFCIRFVSAST